MRSPGFRPFPERHDPAAARKLSPDRFPFQLTAHSYQRILTRPAVADHPKFKETIA
jgi:hypothetical protein